MQLSDILILINNTLLFQHRQLISSPGTSPPDAAFQGHIATLHVVEEGGRTVGQSRVQMQEEESKVKGSHSGGRGVCVKDLS